jgi:hypothetical protein
MPTLTQRGLKNRKIRSREGKDAQLPPAAAKMLKFFTRGTDDLFNLAEDYLLNPNRTELIMQILIPIEIVLNLVIIAKIRCKIFVFVNSFILFL